MSEAVSFFYFCLACLVGKEQEVAEILASGGDALRKDAQGRTPLMHAARSGQEGIIRMLLPVSDAGARDGEEKTALMIAGISRRVEVWGFMEGSRADLLEWVQDAKKDGCLFSACDCGWVSVPDDGRDPAFMRMENGGGNIAAVVLRPRKFAGVAEMEG